MRTFKITKAIKRSEEEYTHSKRFLKLKKEYLKNDDKYIESKRKLAKRWLTEESANKLLKEVRNRE